MHEVDIILQVAEKRIKYFDQYMMGEITYEECNKRCREARKHAEQVIRELKQ